MTLLEYSKLSKPFLIAHGGYSSEFPENTRDAYIGALEYRPDAIEMDVVIDPIGTQLVCHHPSTPSDKHGQFSDEVIKESLQKSKSFLSLENAINELSDKVPFLLIDLKQRNALAYDLLYELIPKEKRGSIVIGARNMGEMVKNEIIEQGFSTLGLLKEPSDFKEYSAAGGSVFRLFEEHVSKETISKIQSDGGLVWVTPGKKSSPTTPRTSGEVTDMRLKELVTQFRVDGVLVNDINAARKIFPK